jgi:hypothetical protein
LLSIYRRVTGDITVEDGAFVAGAASGEQCTVKGLFLTTIPAQTEGGFLYLKEKTWAPMMKFELQPNVDCLQVKKDIASVLHLSQRVDRSLPTRKGEQIVKLIRIDFKHSQVQAKEGHPLAQELDRVRTPTALVTARRKSEGSTARSVKLPAFCWLRRLIRLVPADVEAHIFAPGQPFRSRRRPGEEAAPDWTAWTVGVMTSEVRARVAMNSDKHDIPLPEDVKKRVEFFVRRNVELCFEAEEEEEELIEAAERCYPRHESPLGKVRAMIRTLAAGFCLHEGMVLCDRPAERQTVRGPYTAQLSETIVSLRLCYEATDAFAIPRGKENVEFQSVGEEDVDDEEVATTAEPSGSALYRIRLTRWSEACGVCGLGPAPVCGERPLAAQNSTASTASVDGEEVPACSRCSFPRPLVATCVSFRHLPLLTPRLAAVALHASKKYAQRSGSDIADALSSLATEARQRRRCPRAGASMPLPESSKFTEETSHCTIVDRPISGHSLNPESRLVLKSDFGFFDCADDNEGNPGARGYLAVGAFLSVLVLRGIVQAVLYAFEALVKAIDSGESRSRQARSIDVEDYDPKAVVREGRCTLSCDGEPWKTYAAVDAMDVEELLGRARLGVGYGAAHISIVLDGGYLDIQTVPERLLRPVRCIHYKDGLDARTQDQRDKEKDRTWRDRWRAQEFDFISQTQQAIGAAVKVCQEAPPKEIQGRLRRLEGLHLAAEIDLSLLRGYRPSQISGHGMSVRAQFTLRMAETASKGGRATATGLSKYYIPSACKGVTPVAVYGAVAGEGFCTQLARVQTRTSGGMNEEDACDVTLAMRYDPCTGTSDKTTERVVYAGGPRRVLSRAEIKGDYRVDHLPAEGDAVAQPEMEVDSSTVLMVTGTDGPASGSAGDRHGQDVVYASRRGTLIRTERVRTGRKEKIIFTTRLRVPASEGSKAGFYCQKFTMSHAIMSVHCSGGASRMHTLHPPTLVSRSCPLFGTARRTELALALGVDANNAIFHQKDRDGAYLVTGSRSVVEDCVAPQLLWDDLLAASANGVTVDGKRPTFEELTGRYLGRFACLYVYMLRTDKKSPLLQVTGMHSLSQAKKGTTADRDKSTKPASIENVLMDIIEGSGWTYGDFDSLMGRVTGGAHRLEKLSMCKSCRAHGCPCKRHAFQVCDECYREGCVCRTGVWVSIVRSPDYSRHLGFLSVTGATTLHEAEDDLLSLVGESPLQTSAHLARLESARGSGYRVLEIYTDSNSRPFEAAASIACFAARARRKDSEADGSLPKMPHIPQMPIEGEAHAPTYALILRPRQQHPGALPGGRCIPRNRPLDVAVTEPSSPLKGACPVLPTDTDTAVAEGWAPGGLEVESGASGASGSSGSSGSSAALLCSRSRSPRRLTSQRRRDRDGQSTPADEACTEPRDGAVVAGNEDPSVGRHADIGGKLEGRTVGLCSRCEAQGCRCPVREDVDVLLRPSLVHLVHALESANVRAKFPRITRVPVLDECKYTGDPPSQSEINTAADALANREEAVPPSGVRWGGRGELELTGPLAAAIGTSAAYMDATTFVGDCDPERGRYKYLLTVYRDDEADGFPLFEDPRQAGLAAAAALRVLLAEPLERMIALLRATASLDSSPRLGGAAGLPCSAASAILSETSPDDRACGLFRLVFPRFHHSVINLARFAARFAVAEKRLVVNRFLRPESNPAPVTRLQVPARFTSPPEGRRAREYMSWCEQHYTLQLLRSKIIQLPLADPRRWRVGQEVDIRWRHPATEAELRRAPWLLASGLDVRAHSGSSVPPRPRFGGRKGPVVLAAPPSDAEEDEICANFSRDRIGRSAARAAAAPPATESQSPSFSAEAVLAPQLTVHNGEDPHAGAVAVVVEVSMVRGGVGAVPLAVNFTKGRPIVDLEVYRSDPVGSVRLLKECCPRKVFYDLDESKDNAQILEDGLPFCDMCNACVSVCQKMRPSLFGLVVRVDPVVAGVEIMAQELTEKAALRSMLRGAEASLEAVTSTCKEMLAW